MIQYNVGYRGVDLDIKQICDLFSIDGQYVDSHELNTGIINNTYFAKYLRDGVDKNYILQRINKKVFTEPEKVMENIVRVTNYVRERIEENNMSSKKFVLRAFLSRSSGKPFVIDKEGEYWRCYRFIPNSVTYDTVSDGKIIEGVGTAFGRFQNLLDGFDANLLHVTIPNFHNTVKRYEKFKSVIKEDPIGKVEEVKTEIEKLLSFEGKATKLQKYLDAEKLPLRVTHNDTKCNNVSFDKDTGEALAVLDLDTVMAGAIAYDFGDAIRFIANTLLEDDPNYDGVLLDESKYEAFTKGFITQVKGSLTEIEKQTMNLGVFTMTVELAVRFLTDYVSGENYFKIKYPEHNLVRTRNQIALAEDIIRKEKNLDDIISKYL